MPDLETKIDTKEARKTSNQSDTSEISGDEGKDTNEKAKYQKITIMKFRQKINLQLHWNL